MFAGAPVAVRAEREIGLVFLLALFLLAGDDSSSEAVDIVVESTGNAFTYRQTIFSRQMTLAG